MHTPKRKASAVFTASNLTRAGCSYQGPYVVPPGAHCSPEACEVPSVALVGPPCGPRQSKSPKIGHHSCNQHCMTTTCASAVVNSTGDRLKRALEATGRDGRTQKSHKDLRAHAHPNANVSHMPNTTCVRGTGLCPMAGWTIDQYCPACHG